MKFGERFKTLCTFEKNLLRYTEELRAVHSTVLSGVSK